MTFSAIHLNHLQTHTTAWQTADFSPQPTPTDQVGEEVMAIEDSSIKSDADTKKLLQSVQRNIATMAAAQNLTDKIQQTDLAFQTQKDLALLSNAAILETHVTPQQRTLIDKAIVQFENLAKLRTTGLEGAIVPNSPFANSADQAAQEYKYAADRANTYSNNLNAYRNGSFNAFNADLAKTLHLDMASKTTTPENLTTPLARFKQQASDIANQKETADQTLLNKIRGMQDDSNPAAIQEAITAYTQELEKTGGLQDQVSELYQRLDTANAKIPDHSIFILKNTATWKAEENIALSIQSLREKLSMANTTNTLNIANYYLYRSQAKHDLHMDTQTAEQYAALKTGSSYLSADASVADHKYSLYPSEASKPHEFMSPNALSDVQQQRLNELVHSKSFQQADDARKKALLDSFTIAVANRIDNADKESSLWEFPSGFDSGRDANISDSIQVK